MEQATRVDDVMLPDIDTIGPTEEIRVARRRMESQTRRSLIVVDADTPVGIIEWRGIMRDVPADGVVRDYMIREFPVLNTGMSLSEAQANLGEVDIDRIPVVNESGQLVGEVPRTALSHFGGVAETALTADSGGVHGLPGESAELSESVTDYGATAATTDLPTGPAIRSGMDVIGSGGNKLGTVDDVMLEPTGAASAFLVKHGLISHKHKRINADVVDRVDQNQVFLKIDKDEFKMLANVEDRT